MTFRKNRLDEALELAGRDPEQVVEGALEQRILGSFSREAELDALDILATGCIGAVGAALDVLLVAVPKDVTYLGLHPQKGSLLTRLFKSWVVPSANALAAVAKVPFDAVGGDPKVPGMSPGNHRFMTPGHDPLLGLAVGVHDILRNGRTAIGSDGRLRFDEISGKTEPAPGAAVVLELLHLLSDVATKAGLPAPLMTAAGLLRVGPFGANERTVADLARYMYLEGYDLRHFATTCSVPSGIRLLLGAYVLGRRFVDKAYDEGWAGRARKSGTLLSHPSFEAMLLLADSVACAANAGKIALYHGNPSAFNYAEWLALLQSAYTFVSNQLERPTDVLIDRANANEESLRKRWQSIANALGVEESAFLAALTADPRDL